MPASRGSGPPADLEWHDGGVTVDAMADAEAHLLIGDVTVTYRDVEMLHAIDRYGSMHEAAEALGRSYPHLQRRIVDLEEAIEPLTERERGGNGGGGTRLLPAAHDLIGQYYRLQTRVDGGDDVPESVLPGVVVDRNGDIASVRTSAGTIAALVPEGGTRVAISIRADVVVLQRPGRTLNETTNLQNHLDGTVADIDIDQSVALVTVSLQDEELAALTTVESVDSLELAPGGPIRASFDATSVRGVTIGD